MDEIVLVDSDGKATGSMEKLAAHREGRLHRAFSIFVFNSRGELLLQQRAQGKYHSGGLWSNSCCSHPAPGESLSQATHRRLLEELGCDCDLTEIFTFTYRANVGSGLIEHEFDHVLAGVYDGGCKPDLREVQAWRWLSLPALVSEIAACPQQYTAWLRQIVDHRLPDLLHGRERLLPSAQFAG